MCVELHNKKKKWLWRTEGDLKSVWSFESGVQRGGAEGVDRVKAKATVASIENAPSLCTMQQFSHRGREEKTRWDGRDDERKCWCDSVRESENAQN